MQRALSWEGFALCARIHGEEMSVWGGEGAIVGKRGGGQACLWASDLHQSVSQLSNIGLPCCASTYGSAAGVESAG